MTAAETQAIAGLIREIPYLSGKTFVSEARYEDGRSNPSQVAPPYAVIHPSGGQDRQDRLTGAYVSRRPSWTVHAVGFTPAQAEETMDLIDDKLRPGGVGRTPSVAGHRTGAVNRDALLPVTKEPDVNPALFYQPAEYSFPSRPNPPAPTPQSNT